MATRRQWTTVDFLPGPHNHYVISYSIFSQRLIFHLVASVLLTHSGPQQQIYMASVYCSCSGCCTDYSNFCRRWRVSFLHHYHCHRLQVAETGPCDHLSQYRHDDLAGGMLEVDMTVFVMVYIFDLARIFELVIYINRLVA